MNWRIEGFEGKREDGGLLERMMKRFLRECGRVLKGRWRNIEERYFQGQLEGF